jgi:predicted ester cyclase
MSEVTAKGNVAVVSEMYRAFNEGDMDAVVSFVADDVEWITVDGTYHGIDEVRRESLDSYASRPISLEIDEYLDAGDTVVAFGRFVGTPADGDRFEIPLTHRWDLEDGTVVRLTGYPDSRKMDETMGPGADAKRLLAQENARVIGERDVGFIDEAYADDVIVHMTRAGDPDAVASIEDVKTVYEDWLAAFPDLEIEVHETVVQGDVVMQFFTFRGTHEGAFRSIDATGNEMAVDGFHMRRARDGTIVEMASTVYLADLLDQLGADLALSA